MKFTEGNLNFGEFVFLFFDEKLNFIETQKHIVKSFFEFSDDFIKPYGIELCFELFYAENQLISTKTDYEAFLLKNQNQEVDFTPIWSKSKDLIFDNIDFETIIKFVLEKNNEKTENNYLKGLSHLSFQTGLFKLPEKNQLKYFLLEKENQVNKTIDYQCFSEYWFEAPLKKLFVFPPIELNFSREPYSKAWSLHINLNWDIYSKKNEIGYKILSGKIEKLINLGWEKTY